MTDISSKESKKDKVCKMLNEIEQNFWSLQYPEEYKRYNYDVCPVKYAIKSRAMKEQILELIGE